MKMMKKLKKQGGFSLVELIVVIVIILVLAAVMVPNVTKYIDMASQSNTKNNAASLLTQAQAETAELVGKAHMSGKPFTPANITLGKVTITYKEASAYTKLTAVTAGKVEAYYTLDEKNQVSALAYSDGAHFVNWSVNGSWDPIDGKTE